MVRKLYLCAMEQTRYFNIEADNEDQVMEWLATHNMQDVDNKTKKYVDEWDERICEVNEVGAYKSHIVL